MLNNLTGLRFYAALWVFLYHFFPVYTNLSKIQFFEIGYLGVDVFFVLSGFILTYVYYSKFFINKITIRDYWNFVAKRFAKIYPLHFIITLIFIPLLFIGKYLFHQNSLNVDFGALLQNFLMIHSWNTTDKLTWNFPSWSISAEWFAYLFLFVPFGVIFKKNKYIFLILVTTIFIGYIILWLNTSEFSMDIYTMNGLPRIIPEFILGILVGLVRMKVNLNKQKSALLFSFSFLVTIMLFYYDFYFQQFCIIGFAGIILSLSYKTFFDFLFSSNWVTYLGNISYAFYLTQFLSLIIYEQIYNITLGKFLNFDYVFMIQFLMAFSLNLYLASLAYKYIEEPLRLLLIKKLIRT